MAYNASTFVDVLVVVASVAVAITTPVAHQESRMQNDRPIPTPDPDSLRGAVRSHYAARLEAGACCAPQTANVELVAGAGEVPSFGCGDPTVDAALEPGETVLDLGSGAGFDALRVAAVVGPGGRVIGVDMTPAMLERARATAARLGMEHVEFREGLIEALPVEDASVDVVISNCVLNLSADVGRVLDEAARVLRGGGRLRISDTFRLGAPPERLGVDGWCACEDGAHDPAVLIAQAKRAGFVDVRVDPPPADVAVGATYGAVLHGTKAHVEPLPHDAIDVGAALLSAAGLPVGGWRADGLHRWGVFAGGRLVGVVALEVHGRHALVRSLAVAPDARGRGVGAALLAHATRAARALGLADLAGLTTTIGERLAGLGFREVAPADLPAELHASDELQGACPASARAFVRDLARR